MGIFDRFFKEKPETAQPEIVEAVEAVEEAPVQEIQQVVKRHLHASYFTGWSSGNSWSLSFDGEKNLGEIGPAINYVPDYYMLRMRSKQSYLESEITKTLIDRLVTWTIGKGLKLQASPNVRVLQTEGFDYLTDDNKEEFNRTVEARFSVFCESNSSTWSQNKNLHKLESEAFKECKLGGDVLVILRYKNKQVTVQLIDGHHIMTPPGMPISAEGNRIINGIEIDSRGRHVAYHVRVIELGNTESPGFGMKFDRVVAVGKRSRQTMAFMVYGSEYRVDSVRGMPAISTNLETLKKLERYKEAAVGAAEERAKVPYQIVHGVTSTGENPLQNQMAVAIDPDNPGQVPSDSEGKQMANTVAVSTGKMVFNMPKDSKLESLESKMELYYKDFYSTHFEAICSSIGMPPNVARQLYNDNYSASRAALKDWDQSLSVERKNFADQFKGRIYKFWLWVEVMEGRIVLPGYINAYHDRNDLALEAFSSCRWVGAQVPHIDPVKEVNAVRLALGPMGANLPLMTAEQACEALAMGDYNEIVSQFIREKNEADASGLKPEPPVAPSSEEPNPPSQGS